MVSKPPCIPARLLPKTNTSLGLRLVIKSAQWKNSGGVTRWTLQTFRIAANWHIDLQLATIPYFLLFQKPLKSRYYRPRIPLRANMRLSWAIKWRFWDTISLFLRWIFLWTYVQRFMDVRPKGACTYVHRIYGWNVASIWLKTAGMPGRLRKNPFSLFQIAFSSGSFSDINMSDKITF